MLIQGYRNLRIVYFFRIFSRSLASFQQLAASHFVLIVITTKWVCVYRNVSFAWIVKFSTTTNTKKITCQLNNSSDHRKWESPIRSMLSLSLLIYASLSPSTQSSPKFSRYIFLIFFDHVRKPWTIKSDQTKLSLKIFMLGSRGKAEATWPKNGSL